MSAIFTTALMGFFAYSGVGIASADTVQQIAPPEPTYKTMSVSMTAYHADVAETDGDPYTTASGAFSDPDVVAARSPDLASELPFGTVIELVPTATSTTDVNCGRDLVAGQIGLRVIADSMNPRIHNTIDILMDRKNTVAHNGTQKDPAVTLGKCKNITIKIIGRIPTKNMPKTQAELKLAIGQIDKAPAGNLVVSK